MKNQTSSEVREFDPRRVKPLPNQPRVRFRGIPRLAESIKFSGQTTPGIVTLVQGDKDFDAQLVDGERRLRACLLAKVNFRAEIRKQGDGSEPNPDNLFEMSFVANFNKQDHDCLEIAQSLHRLQEAGKTIEYLARATAKSTAWVSQHLSLLKLHEDVQTMMIPPQTDEESDSTNTNGDGLKEKDSERTHLTLSLALLLVPLAQNVQVELAQTIVKEGMSLSLARRTILKRLRVEGRPIPSESVKYRKRQLKGLQSLLHNAIDRLGIYVDMPKDDLAKLIEETGIKSREEIVRTINELNDNLSFIADMVEAKIPKVVVAQVTKFRKLK